MRACGDFCFHSRRLLQRRDTRKHNSSNRKTNSESGDNNDYVDDDNTTNDNSSEHSSGENFAATHKRCHKNGCADDNSVNIDIASNVLESD